MSCNVPYERNIFYTGREEILQTVYKQLNQNQDAVLSRIQIISGLGGIGKSQTAVEYAYRYYHDYQAILWVRAETELELLPGFVELAHVLDLPQKDAQDPKYIIEAVKHWLENNSGWLLIFDNVDHPEKLKSFVPNQAQGHILLTSRAQNFDALGIARPISLSEMHTNEAIAFLFKRTGRDPDNFTEQAAAATLADELGCLPLALEQAGAYILAKQISFQNYLKSYRKRRLQLLEKTGPIAGDYPDSVATTWTLNFHEVEATSTASADLLRVSAFLSPHEIPYELFERGAGQLGVVLAGVLTKRNDDPIVFYEILAPLIQYSLVHAEPSMRVYNIPRLVQEVVRFSMDGDVYHQWEKRTLAAVTRAFPDSEYCNWPDCDRLLPHAKVVIRLFNDSYIESEIAARLLTRMAYYLCERAQYSEAESLYEKALAIRKRLLGEENLTVTGSLHNLASIYSNQRRYNEAEPLCKEALAIRKRLLGEENLYVARSLISLASIYSNQRRYSEAEAVYEVTLAIYKRLLGDEHLYVAMLFKSLALFYNDWELYHEAEPYYQKALAMYKRLLSDEHSDVANCLGLLAVLYKNQGRYSEAASLYQQALLIWKRLLGDEHPDVALCLNNLAGLYYDQGRYSEAASLYQEVVAMRKRLLGDEHPDVAQSLNYLAEIYSDQGNYSEAELLYQEALTIRQRLFGNEDLEVAHSFMGLALLYENQERYSEAEPLYYKALKIREEKLGQEHRLTKSVSERLEILQNYKK